MRYFIIILFTNLVMVASGQNLEGTWQLTEEKPCIEQQMKQSETEKELLPSFGSSSSAVAKIIRFDRKGKGEESIFTAGRKKGTDKESFRYQVSGDELQFLDKKSGIITERFVIDELTSVSLRFHKAGRDCEMRSFRRIE
ncbi:MAG: lipocalin family protein [Cyclobacteriaceae bacterium]|nr:lipocalin family protein [Cyclobacteriaceae bacterium]